MSCGCLRIASGPRGAPKVPCPRTTSRGPRCTGAVERDACGGQGAARPRGTAGGQPRAVARAAAQPAGGGGRLQGGRRGRAGLALTQGLAARPLRGVPPQLNSQPLPAYPSYPACPSYPLLPGQSDVPDPASKRGAAGESRPAGWVQGRSFGWQGCAARNCAALASPPLPAMAADGHLHHAGLHYHRVLRAWLAVRRAAGGGTGPRACGAADLGPALGHGH